MGSGYLFAATILTGLLQIVASAVRLGNLMRFVSRSVVTGFVNALAILIFLAQMPELIGRGPVVYAMTAIGLAMIYGLPYLTKAVPSPLITILVLTGISVWFGFDIRTVGDMGALPSELPVFALPQVPFTLETLQIILPYALTLAMVGLLESMMTAAILDEMTDTTSNKNRECAGPGPRQRHLRPLRRHGRLRHDRAIGHQRLVRRAGPSLDAVGGRVPAVPHRGSRPLCGANPDGGPRRGDDHGLDQHLPVELRADPADPPEEFERSDARKRWPSS